MNSASRPPVTPGRQSWRQRPAGGRPSAQSRSAARWLTTLVAVLLIGALLYTILQLLQGSTQTYLGAIAVSEYDPVVVPPLTFVTADLEALHSIEKKNLHPWDSADWKSLQESKAMPGLADKLEAFGARPEDSVVIYVRAHGVSDAGRAYVLCSDYLRNGAPYDARRYEIADLLEQFGQCAAGLKLLVLDCGGLGYQSRLGMTPNQFPALVEQAVADCDDPNLWVLLANSPLQTTSVSYSQRRSLFAAALTDALLGAANDRPCGNADLYLSLDELYRYLWNHAVTWSAGDPESGQVPQLLHATDGLVAYDNIPEELYVLEYNTKEQKARAAKKEAAAEAQKKASGKAAKEPKTSMQRGWKATVLATWPPALLQATPPATGSSPPELPSSSAADAPDAPAAGTQPPAAAGNAGSAKDAATSAPPQETVPSGTAERQPARKARASTGRAKASPAARSAPKEQVDEATQDVLSALRQAWEARDQLSARPTSGWSPVDMAPHLWREVEAILLDFEYRARDASRPEILAAQLRLLAQDLQQLYEDIERDEDPRSPLSTHQALIKLVGAWRDFNQNRGGARQSFGEPDLEMAAEAARLARDAAYRAAYEVRSQQQAVFTTPGRVPHYNEVSTLLDRIDQLQQSLDSLRGEFLTDYHRAELRRQMEQVELAQQRLERERDSAMSSALAGLGRPLAERELEDLLSTPLLSAEQRMPLLVALLKPGRTPPTPLEYTRPSGPAVVSASQWTAMRQVAELERKLILLADDAMAQTIQRMHLELMRGMSLDELPAAHQALGQKLISFYRQLPEQTARLLEAGESHQASELLLLIDPRDARRVAAAPELFLRLHVRPLPPAPELTLDVQPNDLAASVDQWQAFHLDIGTRALEASRAAVLLHFDERILRVRSGQRELRSGETLEVAVTAEAQTQVPIEILARRYREEGEEAGGKDVVIQVQAGAEEATHRVVCQLPLPNQVDLLAERLDSTYITYSSQGSDGLSGKLQLRPFPNRTTPFRFALVNRSGQEKTVQVQLLSVPRVPTARWAPGALFDPDNQIYPEIRQALFNERDSKLQLRPDVKPLVQVEGLKLPPGQTVDLDFQAQQPASPPADPGAAAAAPPPAEPSPLPAADVSYGLVCLITNASDPSEQWIKWIEINSLAPKNYIRESISYDATGRRILIDLQIKNDIDGDNRPDAIPMLEELPIRAALRAVGRPRLPAGARLLGGMNETQGADRLFIEAPMDSDTWRIELDVDGYPRALIYDITAREGAIGRDVRQNHSQVVLDSVAPVYAQAELEALGLTEQPPATGLTKSGERVAFRPCDQLLVSMQVDAPENAFLTGDADEFIALSARGQDGRERAHRFYADRHVTTQLVELGQRGLLVLKSQVGDYQVPLDMRGYLNTEVDVSGEVVTRGTEAAREYWTRVVFDATPPELRSLNLSRGPIYAGQIVTATVDARDLHSGIAQIRAGIDKNGSGELEEDEKLGVVAQGEVRLETEGLKTNQPYSVIARVVDHVGWVSNKAVTAFVIVPPPTANPAAPQGPQKGVIQGEVLFQGRAAVADGRVEVRLEGTGQSQDTGPGGTFRFTNVPMGKPYTLVAKGTYGNGFCEGKLEGVTPSPPTEPQRVKLTVDRP